MFGEEFLLEGRETVEGLSCTERVAQVGDLLSTGVIVDVLHVRHVVVFTECVEAEVPVGRSPIVRVIAVLAVCAASGVGEPDVKAAFIEMQCEF